MPTHNALRRCTAAPAAVVVTLLMPTAADAHRTGRGAQAAERPEVAALRCDPDASGQAGCPQGEFLALRGERLARVTQVIFLGAAGRNDNRHAHPRARSPHRVLVRVPAGARSGRVKAVDHAGRSSRRGPTLVVAASTPAPAPGPSPDPALGVFPVRGSYDLGSGVNGFGGGRGHQGQDIFADCGTPVVAARAGEVVAARTGGNEGNYAVVESSDGTQQAYLHMLRPATVRAGDQIAAGRSIGKVGETGNASGCHLHFELWTAPGRFTGGTAYDPAPDLDRWAGSG